MVEVGGGAADEEGVDVRVVIVAGDEPVGGEVGGAGAGEARIDRFAP